MHDLTGSQRDCLVVLAGHDSPIGLAIKDTIDVGERGVDNDG